jgi:putative tryptophan/tyrosine transport system substrate-binding protein
MQVVQLNRRDFMAMLGGCASLPLAAQAQPRGRIAKIGLLNYAPFWSPLVDALRELGYVENQNLSIEYRPPRDKSERLPVLVAELVDHHVDVIVTFGAVVTLAARSASTTTPIVMIAVGDPLGTGLVSSLARPGANITGNTIFGAELGAKRLEMLREMIPSVSHVAFLWNSSNPANELHFDEVRRGAAIFGISIISVPAETPEKIGHALEAMLAERPEALLVTADPMHQLHAERIIEFAARHRLPTMYQLREHVIAGGLMAYGASMPELFRRGALYIDKILKGTKPADLPVEQPTKFELVINLKTANALGLAVPPTLLARAEEVIE